MCCNKLHSKTSVLAFLIMPKVSCLYQVFQLPGLFLTEKTAALTSFLKTVKSRSPSNSINTAMTDDSKFSDQSLALYVNLSPCIRDNTGWSAIQSVFGGDAKHLLCKWHIDQ